MPTKLNIKLIDGLNGLLGSYLKNNGPSAEPTWTAFSSPTITILSSGSGTYNVPVGVKWIKVKAKGGGGSGSNSGTAARLSGNAGGSTTFGTSLITVPGGSGGPDAGGATNGGPGGLTPTINAPAISIAATTGAYGESYHSYNSPVSFTNGTLGGVGINAGGNSSGAAAQANTGAGGAGGSLAGTAGLKGIGGGAGAYAEAIIPAASLVSSYSYAVGAGGAAVAAGTGGAVSFAGGSGVIIIEEFYQ